MRSGCNDKRTDSQTKHTHTKAQKRNSGGSRCLVHPSNKHSPTIDTKAPHENCVRAVGLKHLQGHGLDTNLAHCMKWAVLNDMPLEDPSPCNQVQEYPVTKHSPAYPQKNSLWEKVTDPLRLRHRPVRLRQSQKIRA